MRFSNLETIASNLFIFSFFIFLLGWASVAVTLVLSELGIMEFTKYYLIIPAIFVCIPILIGFVLLFIEWHLKKWF